MYYQFGPLLRLPLLLNYNYIVSSKQYLHINLFCFRKTFACYFLPVILLSLLHNLATIQSVIASFCGGARIVSNNAQLHVMTIFLSCLRICAYISANLVIFVFLRNLRKRISKENGSNLQFFIIAISSTTVHIFWIPYLISGQFKDQSDETVLCGLEKSERVWHIVLYNVADTLWVINSACNFFIYNFIGDKFRKVLKKTYTRSFKSASVKVEDIEHSVLRRLRSAIFILTNISSNIFSEPIVSLQQESNAQTI